MSEEPVTGTAEQPPQGERFSLVYLERGEPTDDSELMRHRIGALINHFQRLRDDLRDEVERRIGIVSSGAAHLRWLAELDAARNDTRGVT